MAKIMAYEYWMQLTNAGALSVRSMALRKLDSALERYHLQPGESALKSLKEAFNTYTVSDPQWAKSPRNRYRAFDILFHGINGSSAVNMSDKEREAWALIYRESQTIVKTLFQGQKLEWRSDLANRLSECYDIVDNSTGVTRNALTVSETHPWQMAKRIFDEIVPPAVRAAVAHALQELLPSFMQDLAASIAPFLGVVKTAGSTLMSAATLIGNEIRLTKNTNHASQAFTTGQADLAARALLRILQREVNAAKFSLTVNASALTAKLVSALADGGTLGNAAIGLASSAVSLINILRVITRDCLERQEANNIMSSGDFEADIFDACPIMGAYMICCVPASCLMNALLAEQAVVGWMGQAEYAWKHHWTPLRATARDLINDHRFVIPGLQKHPGVLGANEDALKAMLRKAS